MEDYVMLITALRNKKGVTLVEVMIALVILLVVFMGLIQASLLSVENAATNVLRDEAVRLATETVTALRTGPFDDLDRNDPLPPLPPIPDPASFILNSSPTANITHQGNASRLGINTVRTARNLTSSYVVEVTITPLEPAPNTINKRVTVLVEWAWKDRTFAHPLGHPSGPLSHRVDVLLRKTS